MPKLEQLLEHRVADYLRFTRYARWSVILIVLASLALIPNQPSGIILGIAGLATIYNILSLVGENRHWHLLTNRAMILVIDLSSALLLVQQTGGSKSLYWPILIFMVISSAYWYGSLITAAVATIEGVAIYLSVDIWDSAQANPFSTIIRILITASLGLYLAWLTRSERTERQELMAISAESEQGRQQLLALINTMSDAVLVTDTGGKVVLHNSLAAAFVATEKKLIGRDFEELYLFSDAENKKVHISLRSIDVATIRRDISLKITDTSVINLMLTVTPYVVDNANKGFIFIMRDITRERTIEQERTDFIAVAQHELRTPLTVAEGNISTVLEPEYRPSDPDAISMLETSYRSLRQLSHIVTDLTTLSLAQTERLDPELESVNIADLFKDLIAESLADAKKKELSLEFNIPADLPPVITSRYLAYEILSNFMSNALKFTKAGTITLSATLPPSGQGVVISVIDTGPGISLTDQKKLFGNFFQSEDWRTRDHGGTGLGLYICDKLARRLTGEVSCQSKLGKGSIFTLHLPPYSRHNEDQTKVAKAETKDFFKYL